VTRPPDRDAAGPPKRARRTHHLAATSPPSRVTVLVIVSDHGLDGPSTYGLTHAELATHIRQLRRAGWQSWEIRARFDFSEAA
jgi:hypothetical protein